MKPLRAFMSSAALAGLAILALAMPPAHAQRAAQPGAAERANIAGAFDYYTLVLSWSPTYCATRPRGSSEPQCQRAGDARPYAFVLHGLWPQYERGYPEYCTTKERPFVPRPLIDRMLDIMPSPRLVIHAYRKHGTCSGLSPEGYYALSRRLYEKVKIPPRFISPAAPFFVAPQQLAEEFVRANPGLKFDMLGIECRGSGNRLREVRICFSREGEFRSCGANEQPRRLCPANRMYVPPVRPGAGPSSMPPPPGQRAL